MLGTTGHPSYALLTATQEEQEESQSTPELEKKNLSSISVSSLHSTKGNLVPAVKEKYLNGLGPFLQSQ